MLQHCQKRRLHHGNRKVQSVQEINDILGIQNLGVIPNHKEVEYEEPSNRFVALLRKVRG